MKRSGSSRAMLFGARGYVVSPPTAASLGEVLEQAKNRFDRYAAAVPPGMQSEESSLRAKSLAGGTVITVFGPKGGVGKTTLATNMAISIRQHTQARVALIDVDADFGDVAVIMGIEPQRTMRDLLTAYRDGELPPLQDYLERPFSR